MNSLKLMLYSPYKIAIFRGLPAIALPMKVIANKFRWIKKLCSKVLAIKVAATSILLTLIFVVFSASISAQEQIKPLRKGIWLTGSNGSKIETYQKDGQWFGKLIASDKQDAPLGIDVLRNFALKEGKWQGEVYSIKREQTAEAIIEPSKESLLIEVSIAFFSKTLEWKNEKLLQ